MKQLKLLLVSVLLSMACGTWAQPTDDSSDSYLFTHLGAGLSIGTDGIGIELATPVTPYLGLRAGVSFFPKVYVNHDGATFNIKVDDIEYTRNGRDGNGRAMGKFNKVEGKLLFDVYPFGNKLSMHVTTGFFLGANHFITGNFVEDPNAPVGGGIAKIENGEQWNVRANNHVIDLRVATKTVKPYLGIGFGRMVPKPTKRVGVACDIGVQFHGTPKLEGYASATTVGGELHKWVQLEADNFDFGEDFHHDVEDALDIAYKVKVWPVLNIRITGRIF